MYSLPKGKIRINAYIDLPFRSHQPSRPKVIFLDALASLSATVKTFINSWFIQGPANMTRLGSSYAGHKLFTKSIKNGLDTILNGIPQHTNNRVRARLHLTIFDSSSSLLSNIDVIFF